mgnify:CR=1 FL=1
MIITKKQILEMLEAAKPLIKWLNENTYPHAQCIVDLDGVRLTEDIAMIKTDEYVKD